MYIASPYRNSLKSASLSGKGYMGISLNSASHSGEALEATVDWINKNTKYDLFLIGLSDTLNRFNLLSSCHEKEAYDMCYNAGNRWLKQNRQILEKLEAPYKIARWDYWKTTYPNKVIQYTELFENLFENDEILKSAVIKDISNFVKRRHSTTIENIAFQTISNCKNYLIEELAVYSIIFENYSSCDVYYPGKQLECMRVIREKLIQTVPNTYEKTNYIRMALHKNIEKTAA